VTWALRAMGRKQGGRFECGLWIKNQENPVAASEENVATFDFINDPQA
jgi:hypothetical protein